MTPVVVHLSGRYRGRTHRLRGEELRIGSVPGVQVGFSLNDLTPGTTGIPEDGIFAVLRRRGQSYELEVAPEADVWVNGEKVDHLVLASGDVLEIGRGGPVLRFRLYEEGSEGYKSLREAFSDCIDCARHERGLVGRAGALLGGTPRELLTQTAPQVRIGVLSLLVVVVGAIGALWVRNVRLEDQLEKEAARMQGLAALLESTELTSFTADDFAAAREELDARLADNRARIDALEAMAEARGRVIEATSRSIMFLQGSYGFEEVATGRPLRFPGVGPDGAPLVEGGAGVTLEGDGPLVEMLYTGTAFVATEDGILVTNRHVALPWEFDSAAEAALAEGFRAVMLRFEGYLPGIEEPFEVELVRASDANDVALLRCFAGSHDLPLLRLTETGPTVGDEIIVMGYPTGMQALLARADPAVVDELVQAGPMDFWEVAHFLAANGSVAPLATVGVVGQVTPASVVYDAETTHGGSGGPVLNLDGEVLAVNAAILAEFGGSNMGVPAAEAMRLLRAEAETP